MRIAFRVMAYLVFILIADAYAAEKPLPGLLVVNLTVQDPAKFAAYAEKSRPILAAHGAALLFRGTNPTVLFGKNKHQALIGFNRKIGVGVKFISCGGRQCPPRGE